MKYLLSVIITFFTFSAFQAQSPSLMPIPEKYELSGIKFRMNEKFTISLENPVSERVQKGTTRFLRRLSERTTLFFQQDYITEKSKSDSAYMVIRCSRKGNLEPNEDESYSLLITKKIILLEAETDIGILRGLETVLQLIDTDKDGYFLYGVEIHDTPRFTWRGLLIDVCRHFMPVEVIKRNLDGMAAVKMNVLHLHLSEDQGFRVESKIYPELHRSGSDGKFFTQCQVKDIIQYADDRGIRIIPEFDIPGHATSWFVSHPELASAPGPYTIERRWGIKDPVFNPAIDTTYRFLDRFLGEMAALFPDEYLHIGGDENNGKHWDANEQIQQFMNDNDIKNNHELQTYFNNKILEILTRHGKKMVGWDEILQPGMPANIVIQSWRGTESLIESARKGYMGILSNGYYIDLMHPASFHYSNDPLPQNSELSPEEKKLILGGEATMWAELVTPETVDSRIWPRTAAIAERLWSPSDIRDIDDMYRRLETVSFRLEELGLTHIKNRNMMLRRLTNNSDYSPLEVLLDVAEPVKVYQRHFQGVAYTSYSPYTRFVDITTADAKYRRKLGNLVESFISSEDPEILNILRLMLTKWKNNHQEITALAEQAPAIAEIIPLSENLMKLAEYTLNQIEIYSGRGELVNKKGNDSQQIFEEAKKPFGQAELVIVDDIKKFTDFLRDKK